jgi:hypothetical protein
MSFELWTRTWAAMTRGALSSVGSSELAIGSVDRSSITWNSTLPKATRAPGEATPSLTREPLMKVPLVDPRSRMRKPLPAASTSP